ncbi:hypothetical protein ABZW30_39415 [Kitasatospora sp. NPDC004669]
MLHTRLAQAAAVATLALAALVPALAAQTAPAGTHTAAAVAPTTTAWE